MDKILCERIFASVYWKDKCFNVNEVGVCELAASLKHVNALIANRPTPFICLVEKLVLLKPAREIVEEMLAQPFLKYLTALAAFYVRLVYAPLEVYRLLEPLLGDWRKLRTTDTDILHMDEFVDLLLTEKRVFGVVLPRLPPRPKLEDEGLELRPVLLE